MSKEKLKEQVFLIHRIYVKDISFEAPNTPQIFEKECIPNMKFNINTDVKELKLNVFEVTLKVRVIVQSEKDLVFLCDVHQAGVFFISNLNEQELRHCVSSYCPSILFPYARTCISTLVTYGSFPQLNLVPINFDHFFNKHKKFKKDDVIIN
ncbi:protein-export chaperone SecB [Buchnera aphidicola]|uniref:Protein-export protein SecB n=1 Tax=Buchnera aphidicola (Aphis nerii) TaxID=1241835 RepID=A0A4D6XWK5_9GAMM|nr:protein-export chaperone SecB [Buchnera aphidicola]QCI18620.1 protein-export chaperone SecB [Buchnera aphidicola (Aphis nerii)]